MITLEQIRLLEGKITRALELIRVLKEENTTLRKGLESAQKRMRELEALVDGFKTDQKEIESIIVRTLHNLDELEETAAASAAAPGASRRTEPRVASGPAAPPQPQEKDFPPRAPEPEEETPSAAPTPGEELDIF
jgi:peptidoglycan hydrolase CwlO-like protein